MVTLLLYALGAVSALGFQSGSGGTDSATITTLTTDTLTVNTSLTMGAGTRIAQASGVLYIGMASGSTYVRMSNVGSASGTSYWYITKAGSALFKEKVQCPKFYFDSTKYLYLDSGALKYFDGTDAKTVVLQ